MDAKPTFLTLRRFWNAQSIDTKAKILAFVHLVDAAEVETAHFHVSQSGSLRLFLKAYAPEDADELEPA